jgi:hypothetical protein
VSSLLKHESKRINNEETIPKELTTDTADLVSLRTADIELSRDKLDRVEEAFVDLAVIMPKISLDLYNKNRDEFERLAMEAEEKFIKIRAFLVNLKSRVKTEYTSIPLSRRFVLFLLSFFSSEAQKQRTYVLGWMQTRKALLGACNDYDRYTYDLEEKITSIREHKIRVRMNEILAKNSSYQDLLDEIAYLEKRGINVTDYCSKMRALKNKKSELRTRAFHLAQAELEKDNMQ